MKKNSFKENLRLTTIILIILVWMSQLGATNDKVIEVIYSKETSIREIAKNYLNKAEYWQNILLYNNLDLNTLKLGSKLKIPVGIFSSISIHLDIAKTNIDNANAFGASRFAKKLIAEAIQYYEQAIELRKKNKLVESLEVAKKASVTAEIAIKKTEKERVKSGIATLESLTGKVDTKKISERYWKLAKNNQTLAEKETIRTLSNSRVKVKFEDGSNLSLGPNSQATIKAMSGDLLLQKKFNKVSILGGDIHALLGPKSNKNAFKLETKYVEIDNSSRNFFLQSQTEKNIETLKISNYDSNEMNLDLRGKELKIGAEQGMFYDGKSKPKVVDLLPAPVAISPKNSESVYKKELKMKWQSVRGAKHYWLALAKDDKFENIIYENKYLNQNEKIIKNLPKGIYYWQVCAVDKYGIPSKILRPYTVIIDNDKIKPYIVLDKVQGTNFVSQKQQIVRGSTEPNASLQIGNEFTLVDENGSFEHVVNLNVGENVIDVVAVDLANNITKKQVVFNYLPNEKFSKITLDKSHNVFENNIYTHNSPFFLKGKVAPNWRVIAASNQTFYSNQGVADFRGNFSLKLVTSLDKETFNITAISPTGYQVNSTYNVNYINSKPAITLAHDLPQMVTDTIVAVKGCVNALENKIYINGKITNTDNMCFDELLELKEGENNIILSAINMAGRETKVIYKIIKDNNAPNLRGVKMKKVEDGYEISLFVDDATDLKNFAKYVINIDGKQTEHLLRYYNMAEKYYGVLKMPRNQEIKEIKIASVELADYLGNVGAYSF